MRLIECIQTKNPSYTRNRKIRPVGIFVHSTGCSNDTLKRYVDCPNELGTNLYGNHWNKDSATKSMHGFIGRDKNGNVATVHTLPYDIACWGAGGGSKGSANYDPQAHIQFEVCEDHAPRSGKAPTETQRKYYEDVWRETEEYCVYLCKLLGFTEKNITSHYEMAAKGYASGHGDPRHWMVIFGDSMDKFRSRVAARLKNTTQPIPTPDPIVIPKPPVVVPPTESINGRSPYKVKVNLSREENYLYYGKQPGDVVEIDLEDYVKGVVGAEIGNKYPASCRAQAIAARTIAIRNKSNVLVDTTALQAYEVTCANPKVFNVAVKAVDDTFGQILTYDDKPIDCYYSDSNGGMVRVPENTWRLHLPKEERGNSRPYYKEATDPWTTESKNGHGIGLSQKGAIRAASLGKSHQDILAFYYPRTKIINYYGETNQESEVPIVGNYLYKAIVQTSKPLSLNLWSKPSKIYESYHLIPKGDTVEVLEEINDNWVKISHNSKEGYVDPQYLVKLPGTGTTPTTPTDPNALPYNQLLTAVANAVKILQDAIGNG